MIFITGATGLLGSFICKDLLARGYEVKAIKRQTSSMTLLGDAADKINWVIGDMDDTTTLIDALKGVEKCVPTLNKSDWKKALDDSRAQINDLNCE